MCLGPVHICATLLLVSLSFLEICSSLAANGLQTGIVLWTTSLSTTSWVIFLLVRSQSRNVSSVKIKTVKLSKLFTNRILPLKKKLQSSKTGGVTLFLVCTQESSLINILNVGFQHKIFSSDSYRRNAVSGMGITWGNKRPDQGDPVLEKESHSCALSCCVLWSDTSML